MRHECLRVSGARLRCTCCLAAGRKAWLCPDYNLAARRFEVAFLSPIPHGLRRSQAVYAIKASRLLCVEIV